MDGKTPPLYGIAFESIFKFCINSASIRTVSSCRVSEVALLGGFH